MVKAIESFQEFQTVINGDKPVIIDFWATWCGPCKMISPHFNKLESQFEDVDFYKVDVDEQEEVAAEVNVRAMPTFLIFYKGQKIESVTGASPPKLTAALKGLAEKIASLSGAPAAAEEAAPVAAAAEPTKADDEKW
ncbi:thioredoxin-like protein [Mrakia frigida]|uniref:thioredoxin family protein n=1 Tax=Mrakia frigida TaxID=29902 RepID=UPI003FCC21B4